MTELVLPAGVEKPETASAPELTPWEALQQETADMGSYLHMLVQARRYTIGVTEALFARSLQRRNNRVV